MFGLTAGEHLKWVNEARIWAAVGSAIFAVLAMGAGWAQIRLQTVVGREKDDALATYKADAAERVAKLEHETADAKREQERLKKENLELQRTIQIEQEKLLRLESRVGPRHLSAEDASKILTEMKKAQTDISAIVSITQGKEARIYGVQIAEAMAPACKKIVIDWDSPSVILGTRTFGIYCNATAEFMPIVQAAFKNTDVDIEFSQNFAKASVEGVSGLGGGNFVDRGFNVWIDVKQKAPHA